MRNGEKFVYPIRSEDLEPALREELEKHKGDLSSTEVIFKDEDEILDKKQWLNKLLGVPYPYVEDMADDSAVGPPAPPPALDRD